MKTVRRAHELRAGGPVELSGKMEAFSAAVRMRKGRILGIEWVGGTSTSAQSARILYQIPVPGDGPSLATD